MKNDLVDSLLWLSPCHNFLVVLLFQRPNCGKGCCVGKVDELLKAAMYLFSESKLVQILWKETKGCLACSLKGFFDEDLLFFLRTMRSLNACTLDMEVQLLSRIVVVKDKLQLLIELLDFCSGKSF